MLARLGFVVLSYDMVGYNDSCQVEHRWPPQVLRRPLLYGIGPFGLQLWNSIRAVDFVSSLPDVDPERIGCTGASGGATQTYYLALVDDRIRVAVPVCMMSAHYQGGCACEEAPLLHLGDLTTVDVVAALAPRPVLLPSVTQDWTNQNPEYEFPAVRAIYVLYGAEDRVANVHFDVGWFDSAYDGMPQVTCYGPIAAPTRFFGPDYTAAPTMLHLLTYERYLVNIWKTIPVNTDGDTEEDYVELMRKEVIRILNVERANYAGTHADLTLVIPLDEGRALHERDRVPRLLRVEIMVQANYQTP